MTINLFARFLKKTKHIHRSKCFSDDECRWQWPWRRTTRRTWRWRRTTRNSRLFISRWAISVEQIMDHDIGIIVHNGYARSMSKYSTCLQDSGTPGLLDNEVPLGAVWPHRPIKVTLIIFRLWNRMKKGPSRYLLTSGSENSKMC